MMFPGRSRSRLTGILPTVVVMVAAGAAIAQDPPGSRYPISKADIAKQLSVVGVSVEASQVHIPVGVSAAGMSPKFEIVTAEPMGNNQVRLELRCSTAAECLPFFAALDMKEANLVSAEIRLKPGRATAANRQAAMQVGAGAASQPQIEVGSHALLIIRDGHLDIHLQVVAIDTGVLGQQVRVCTLDRKKVFRATVTGEGTVTGAIE
jgi:hypothetical protein